MAVQVVTGQVNQQVSFTELGTIAFNTSAQYSAAIPTSSNNFTYNNTTGGALGIDTIYAHQYTLAGTTVTIDLFGGSLLSPSGKACVFGRVREFVVTVVDTTSTHLINVQSGASSGVLWLPPAANTLWATPNGGGIRLWDPNSITTAGFLVDTSHKNITFDSGALTVVFNVLVVGNSSAS
jgi:hypothetical protein